MKPLVVRLRHEALEWSGLTHFDPGGHAAREERKLVGLLREAADEIERHMGALADLLSSHDNLYRMAFAALGDQCDPKVDIAAKAARELVQMVGNDGNEP